MRVQINAIIHFGSQPLLQGDLTKLSSIERIEDSDFDSESVSICHKPFICSQSRWVLALSHGTVRLEALGAVALVALWSGFLLLLAH